MINGKKMIKDNLIQQKSFDFAIEIINLYKYLKEKNEFILSKQILRSATSVWANVEEAIGWQTKKDFLTKIYTALKEARETLTQVNREKEGAFDRVHDLESQIEQSEVVKIKGKLKEREASLFSEENRELQSKLEKAVAQNLDLERKYETLKKSFSEVRESLAFLRDSCKANYYNLSETPE